MTGSLQTKNGKYYAVINTTDINGNRKQKWISTGFETKGNKKRAEQFLRDKLKEFELQENLIQTDILFSDYIAHWLEKSKIRLDKITYQGYANIANAHIIPYFRSLNKSLKAITRDDIQKYVEVKAVSGRVRGNGGLSPKSLKTHMIIIKQALTEAVKSNLILNSPCQYIAMPKLQKHKANFYTANELQNMLNLFKSEPLYPLIYFTVIFGLRRSEVLGLKWDSVNFDTNTITIKYTVVRYTDIVEKESTKSESSMRSYPMSEEVKSILFSLMEQEKHNRLLFGSEYIENSYIFKWENGSAYKPDYISRKFRLLLDKYELRHIRFHDLRHSCASLLVANGFTLKDIQEWLGHADIQTTANIYAHLDVERKNKIATSMVNSLNF